MLWIRREEGQDLTEYALIIALIVILAIAALTFLGGNIGNVLNSVAGSLANAVGG